MSSMLNNTMGTAKHVIDSARTGTEHAVSNTGSTLLGKVHTVAGIFSLLRNFDIDHALGLLGLARRRGFLSTMVIFSAGIAVGAGAGMLLAPTSGAELRRSILAQLKGLKRDAKEALGKVEAEVEEIEGKAEELAGKAKDKAEELAGTAEDKAEEFAGKAKDKAEELAGKAEDAVEQIEHKVEHEFDHVDHKEDAPKNGVAHAKNGR